MAHRLSLAAVIAHAIDTHVDILVCYPETKEMAVEGLEPRIEAFIIKLQKDLMGIFAGCAPSDVRRMISDDDFLKKYIHNETDIPLSEVDTVVEGIQHYYFEGIPEEEHEEIMEEVEEEEEEEVEEIKEGEVSENRLDRLGLDRKDLEPEVMVKVEATDGKESKPVLPVTHTLEDYNVLKNKVEEELFNIKVPSAFEKAVKFKETK